MAAYRDGTDARTGDRVVGRPADFPHDVTGVVERVDKQPPKTRIYVAFTDVRPIEEWDNEEKKVKVTSWQTIVDRAWGEASDFAKLPSRSKAEEPK